MNLRAVKKEGLPYNDLWDLFKMVSYNRSYVVPSGLYCSQKHSQKVKAWM